MIMIRKMIEVINSINTNKYIYIYIFILIFLNELNFYITLTKFIKLSSISARAPALAGGLFSDKTSAVGKMERVTNASIFPRLVPLI